MKLFDRQPNCITLTPTGKLAAKLAEQLLQDNRTLVTTVRNYDQTNRVIKIACSAPGPRFIAERLPVRQFHSGRTPTAAA